MRRSLQFCLQLMKIIIEIRRVRNTEHVSVHYIQVNKKHSVTYAFAKPDTNLQDILALTYTNQFAFLNVYVKITDNLLGN
jgi:hypothetical protein